MKKLLYGAAYYDEYMPYDRLQQDVAMMKKAGINTVRIAESTWPVRSWISLIRSIVSMRSV